jgi:hypothetical protein
MLTFIQLLFIFYVCMDDEEEEEEYEFIQR